MNSIYVISGVVILLLAGYFIYWFMQRLNERDRSELSKEVTALEIEYDRMRLKENDLLKEMRIFTESISPANYLHFTSLLENGNKRMVSNVELRKALLAEISPLPRTFNDTTLHYRHQRSMQRIDSDVKRCELVSDYVDRLQSKTLSYFPALKALGEDLKTLGKEGITSN